MGLRRAEHSGSPENLKKGGHPAPEGVVAEVQAQNSAKGQEIGGATAVPELLPVGDPAKAMASITALYNKLNGLPDCYKNDFLACYNGTDNLAMQLISSNDR